METCLPRINQYMLTAEVAAQSDQQEYPFKKLNIWYEDFHLGTPEKNTSGAAGILMNSQTDNKMYPAECRMRGLTYSAPFYATVARKFDDETEEKVTLCLGDIPVMVTSKFCNLHNLTEEELTKKKEDCFEFGGYFIVNGNEKVARMLIMNKRNYPIAF